MLTDERFWLSVLHATDGDAGGVAPGLTVEPCSLGRHRRDEAREAWRAVGREPDRDVWLGHQDGDVAAVGHGRLVEEVTRFLEDGRPDVVITFGPEGITGHPDHIAIGRATDEAFERVRQRAWPRSAPVVAHCDRGHAVHTAPGGSVSSGSTPLGGGASLPLASGPRRRHRGPGRHPSRRGCRSRRAQGTRQPAAGTLRSRRGRPGVATICQAGVSRRGVAEPGPEGARVD